MRSLLILSLLCWCFGLNAQQAKIEDWAGEWQGTLEIHNTKGLSQTVQMELNISALNDSTWTWQIVYGAGEKAQPRNYELIKRGDSGHYIMDEMNSIELYMSYINQGFFSWFEVQQSQLLVSYELREGKIMFRTYSAGSKDEMATGGAENTPEVKARKTGVSQWAVLSKK